MREHLRELLHGSKVVLYDPKYDVYLCWKAGTTVNVFNEFGTTVAMWRVEDEPRKHIKQRIIRSMLQRISGRISYA